VKLLGVRRLAKTFTLHGLDGKSIVGCEDVGFRVERGSCLAITGPSGAGKSTVLKCIYRTYLPTDGRIVYRPANGEPVDLTRADDRTVLRLRATEIAYVPQFLRAVPRVPALDIVAEGAVLAGAPFEAARQAAAEILARLHLPRELWDAYPASFSGGERQRVSVARACLLQPRLLLVDEPTASLDPETKRDVVELLGELKATGTGIVAILHDREVVEHLADDVLQMVGGRACPAIC
jgi:alpha-D-ribose 1-methylphosphonate 5-triphosphate synthase subunit PhnL